MAKVEFNGDGPRINQWREGDGSIGAGSMEEEKEELVLDLSL